MAKQPLSRTLQCYHCRHVFEASLQTMSTACPKCAKRLQVEDVIIRNVQAVTKLQTCGKLLVRRRGRIVADLVEAHQGIEVLGELQAGMSRGGPIRIGPKAKWTGDCHTTDLKIELGAQINGGNFVVPDHTLDLPSDDE